jgi:ParB family chromosome partitioning protein
MSKKRGLGKGLSALLEHAETDITSNLRSDAVNQIVGGIADIPIESIEANPFQPRNQFKKEPLLQLAESIKKLGVIQPITVRKLGRNQFQLISGERRFRASQIAGLDSIPAYIRIANDQTMLEIALVENIQREDLNAIEVALSFQRLIEECDLTQEALSIKIGKKRSTVTNYIRLLKLSPEVQLALISKDISMGHARSILSIDDVKKQSLILKQIISGDLSVRQTEELVKGKPVTAKSSRKKPQALSLTQQKFKEDLSEFLKTPVNFKILESGKGSIEIKFRSQSELAQIMQSLDL